MGTTVLVVLDGYALNPGDLSWDGLRSIGPCTIHDRTPAELTFDRARGAEIVLTNKVVLDREMLSRLSSLRYVGVLATGFNVVDTVAAAERGIPVTNVPEYGTQSVGQMTFALLLELTQHVGHHAATVRAGRWRESPDFCYWDHPLVELDGLTMGLVGLGRIGQIVAKLARAFNLRVVACDPRRTSSPLPHVEMVDLETLLGESDVVSLHCPLTAENENMINAERLAWMKPTAFLINTSRGPLIHEADLAAALNAGRLAGAAVDVLSVEPPSADNPLLTAANCLVTPHIAWASRAARGRLLDTAVENIRAFLAGASRNVVNAVKSHA